jgi:tRNA dimethylallyltransferase
MQAVGYKEPIAFLSGQIDQPNMHQQIVFHTRQFVRRQEMWLRSLPEVKRIEIPDDQSLSQASDSILSLA